MNISEDDNRKRTYNRGIVIENKIWAKLRAIIPKKETEFRNASEIVRDVLKKYAKKKINFEEFISEERKQRRIYLDKEPLESYEKNPKRWYILCNQ